MLGHSNLIVSVVVICIPSNYLNICILHLIYHNVYITCLLGVKTLLNTLGFTVRNQFKEEYRVYKITINIKKDLFLPYKQ